MLTKSDITAAIHTGQCCMVFLRGEPDQYGKVPCLKRWDDSTDWHLITEHQNGESRIDAEIAESALHAVKLRIVYGASDWVEVTL